MVSIVIISLVSAAEIRSISRDKRLTNLNGDKSLQGLEIDWHLANAEMGFDNFVEPTSDYQPTYANA